MTCKADRNKNLTRPRKKPSDRLRRIKTQRKRLIALGMPEDEVVRMTATEVRRALKHPERVKKEIASRNQ
jgi:hypothetical protein